MWPHTESTVRARSTWRPRRRDPTVPRSYTGPDDHIIRSLESFRTGLGSRLSHPPRRALFTQRKNFSRALCSESSVVVLCWHAVAVIGRVRRHCTVVSGISWCGRTRPPAMRRLERHAERERPVLHETHNYNWTRRSPVRSCVSPRERDRRPPHPIRDPIGFWRTRFASFTSAVEKVVVVARTRHGKEIKCTHKNTHKQDDDATA